MSEIVILNSSFNNKRINKTNICLDNNELIIERNIKENIKYNKYNPLELNSLDLIYSHCPSPSKRYIIIAIYIFALISFILTFILKGSIIYRIISVSFGIISAITAIILSKYFLKKSPMAIQIVIASKKEKLSFIGFNSTEKDYNNMVRILKGCKKINPSLNINFNVTK